MPASNLDQSAQVYWDRAAATYQQDFAGTLIGRTRRDAVWRELDAAFHAGRQILEVNCGTGIDAIHLAAAGVHVLACDISARMIDLARERARAHKFGDRVQFRVLATEDIGTIAGTNLFDGALSNFSGLNCVQDIGVVRESLARLLKPGATLLMSVMGRFVPWEVAWFVAHRDLGTAFRRWRLSNSYPLQAGELKVEVRSVGEMARLFAPEFRLKARKGIGIAVPPSYMERWTRRFPKITVALANADRLLGSVPVIRGMADCALLSFERTGAESPKA